jgi:hypothetical protein
MGHYNRSGGFQLLRLTLLSRLRFGDHIFELLFVSFSSSIAGCWSPDSGEGLIGVSITEGTG